jgi:mono/diheme cytochrome c family protein
MFKHGLIRLTTALAGLLLLALPVIGPSTAANPTAFAEQDESVPQVSGNADRGAGLFTGETPLTNGGAPCLACHGIAGVGLAGGANFGPDLTALYENYGEDGIAEVLAGLPFPSMEPIYATRPLTADEQLDLGAYFAVVNGAPVINDRLLLTEVASGVLILLGVVLLFGWGRLQDVRRSLLERASNQKGGKR